MNKISKLEQTSSLDSPINELVAEAKTLLKHSDSASEIIRKLESSLKECSAYFPFRYYVSEEKQSAPKQIQEYHREAYPFVVGCRTKVMRYLSWEETQETAKTYRLCLVSEEKEIVYYNVDCDRVYQEEFSSKLLKKNPLIQEDLPTRMRYIKYLLPFIYAFKKHLKSSRTWIETGTDDPDFGLNAI